MKRHAISNEEGTTLVELLVAATIMLVIIAAVIAVIRAGTELEISDTHRRVARSHLITWFEKDFTADNFNDYSQLADGDFPYYPFGEEGDDNTPIDLKSGIMGTLFVTVTKGTENSWGTAIPFFQAEASIVWSEGKNENGEDINQSIILTKQISNIVSIPNVN